ncbi:unnamed protein product [Ixodes persulcatus]
MCHFAAFCFVTESILLLYMQDGTIPVTPCVVYTGCDVEGAETMSLYVDRTEVFKVANTEEGLAAIMAAYWLFGIAYGKKIYNTACLLERICLKLSFSPLRAVAIKVVNKMLKN